MVKGINGYSKDRFEHEQYLVIEEKGRRVLISGCAHNGIPNILEEYQKTYGAYPDQVISGFHFKKKSEYTDTELLEIINTAKSLNAYHTHFTTCHCTGIPAYSVMKNIMGDKLGYVHSGEKVALVLSKPKNQKRRSKYMKCHKFFAWGTVFCFVLTMITGYKKK